MRHNFKTEFLVCLDLSQDVNYVVGRAPTMEGARELTKLAKSVFPDDKVYITKEMVLQQNLKQITSAAAKPRLVAANPEIKMVSSTTKCKCGKKAGQCVGSLNCQCNPIATCKKADKWVSNPIEDDSDDEDDVDDLDLEEDFEYEEDGDEADEEVDYASNPEEIDEEEFEEDYRDNPDEDEDEDEDEDDEDFEDEDDDDDDNDDDDDED